MLNVNLSIGVKLIRRENLSKLRFVTKIRIYYDKEKASELESKLFEKWGKDRKDWSMHGYHISDLSYCPLRTYCRKTGIKQKITKKSLAFMIFGIIGEQVISSIFPPNQRQYKVDVNNLVFGTLDIFENHETPIECKISAKRIFKKEQLPERWCKQLMNYLVLVGKNRGWLLILNIFSRNFTTWSFEMDSGERLMQLEVLMHKITKFDNAIKNKNPDLLDIDPTEYSECGYKSGCPRKTECFRGHKKLQDKKKVDKTKKVDPEKTAKCSCGAPINPRFKKCWKCANESVQKES